jgi:uncharacterized membrane protein
MPIAIGLHLLGALIWVGGMFFAHMVLRPTVNEMLEPATRLPLMRQVFERFFPWVWLSVLALLASGHWMLYAVFQGPLRLYVHLMMGLGWLMALLFAFIWWVPYGRLRRAVDAAEWTQAAAQLGLIRRVILINLLLGLVTSVVGAAGRYL